MTNGLTGHDTACYYRSHPHETFSILIRRTVPAGRNQALSKPNNMSADDGFTTSLPITQLITQVKGEVIHSEGPKS